MPKKLTTEEYISKARSVHGDKYGYSKVVYKNNKTKVTIICPIHGDFEQAPNVHLQGQGCPKCSGNYKPTTEEFIEIARKVHENKYDYSKTTYKNNKAKVIITCPIHGDFLQRPNDHLKGYGCPKCGKERMGDKYRRTKNVFIRKAREVHGNKYDYSKVEYKNSKTKVMITCSTHGDFAQTPNAHLQGKGCSKCSGVYKLTTEEFVEKSRRIHGNKYGYEKVVYENSQTRVIIVCPTHGEFLQTSSVHLQGQGCPKCSGNYKPTTEEFIEKAREVHGNKYDYSKVNYINSKVKVVIICPTHGDFEQIPNSHLMGNGCSKCRNDKLSVTKTKWTYELCYETAKKYEWLNEFRKQDETCYHSSIKNNFLKYFTWLKRNYDQDENIITAKKHCIYKYEFPLFNSVYIGLTMDLEKRHRRGHCKKSTVYKFCRSNNIEIPQPQIIEDNLNIDEAKIREGYWIEYYKNQGYKLLNKAKAGSVGLLHRVKTGNETALFIRKARKVHGDRYNYDKVNYINCGTKVIVTCLTHGEFLQTPVQHLQGQGCSKCAGKYRSNTEEFITKAKQVHGDKYGYFNVKYVNCYVKVMITCPTHGEFEQKPHNHLQGSGCPKCLARKRISDFINKAKKVHGNRYDYSKVEYSRHDVKVTIVCPVHGEFEQTPLNHLRGHGCPKCGKEKLAISITKWTYETCKEESKKYKLRSEFMKSSSGAYEASKRNGWLNEFYPKK